MRLFIQDVIDVYYVLYEKSLFVYSKRYTSDIKNIKRRERMMKYYEMTKDDLFKKLKTAKEGLSSEQAEERLETYGKNVICEAKRKSVPEIFISQFVDLLVIILIVAAVISAFSGSAESAAVIICVIILNAVMGTVQKVKAQKSLDALKTLSAAHTKVIRNGEKTEVFSEQIVPGDIIVLEAGDMVTADARILEVHSFQVNESSLTGEAENVSKSDIVLIGNVPLADRKNMVYSGSLVTNGRALAAVSATGMETEIGKIAGLMNKTKESKTPLQTSLDDFSTKLAVIIFVMCGIVFLLSVYRNMPLLEALMFAVALAVAAIPEALGAIVTMVQAAGTLKMAKEKAIIKDLKAVESLGCVSVICTDKTGTLTQNKMEVQEIYIDKEIIAPSDIKIENELHRYLLYNAVLNNDAGISEGKIIGDPTEYALLEMFRSAVRENKNFNENASPDENYIRSMMLRQGEAPFDSDRKLMSTKYNLRNKPIIFTKGAPDVLTARCDRIHTKNGISELSESDKEQILCINNEFSKKGLRVLAFAYKPSGEEVSEASEYGMIFIGLTAMYDPPRKETKPAVESAAKAGIKTVMITGDHKVTAAAIAEKTGIFKEGDIVLTGAELDAMSDEEFDDCIEKVSVYARVSPENKIRIVSHWQKRGNVTAMTGDGVNDAPALKKADIGVAMGVTGTEVSKSAAAMVLADDNFATIIKAVENGRNVYKNIKNAILFLLSGNMAGILAVLYASLLGLPMPFTPVQLLFINLVTDSLPALAIGMERSKTSLLEESPRDPKEGILTKRFTVNLLLQGVLIACASMTGFYTGMAEGKIKACTMAFAVLTLARLFHGFNCRTEDSILKDGVSKNKYMLCAFFAGVLLLTAVLTIPFAGKLFDAVLLDIKDMGLVAAFAVIPTAIIQIVRVIKEKCIRYSYKK